MHTSNLVIIILCHILWHLHMASHAITEAHQMFRFMLLLTECHLIEAKQMRWLLLEVVNLFWYHLVGVFCFTRWWQMWSGTLQFYPMWRPSKWWSGESKRCWNCIYITYIMWHDSINDFTCIAVSIFFLWFYEFVFVLQCVHFLISINSFRLS